MSIGGRALFIAVAALVIPLNVLFAEWRDGEVEEADAKNTDPAVLWLTR
jgi:hypothetical protein